MSGHAIPSSSASSLRNRSAVSPTRQFPENGWRQGGVLQVATPETSGGAVAFGTSIDLTSSSSAKDGPSIDEHELIALVVEMRLRDSRSTKSASNASNEAKETTVPSDSSTIDTLDLCHRRIELVPDALMDILHDEIVRLALGYNQITRLPDNFAQLHLLRYLNIRSNNFSVFPEVLCSLPALEILELSRNKIRKLPVEPKRLIHLRVLSMSHNRLRALPAWLPQMKQLRILKLDQNPIEWPPPHVSVMPIITKAPLPARDDKEKTDDVSNSKEAITAAKKKAEERHMQVWISQVKKWITEDLNRKASQAARSPEASGFVASYTHSTGATGADMAPAGSADARDESERPPVVQTDSAVEDGDDAVVAEDVLDLSKVPRKAVDTPRTSDTVSKFVSSAPASSSPTESILRSGDDDRATPTPGTTATPPTTRTLVNSAPNSIATGPLVVNAIERHTSPPPPPPNLHVEPVPRMPAHYSPHASPLVQTNLQSRWDFGTTLDTLRPGHTAIQSHSRNNSYSLPHSSGANGTNSSERPPLRSKKSLPDMRQSHGAILSERSQMGSVQVEAVSSNGNARRPSASAARRPAMPPIASTPAVPAVVMKNGLRELTLGRSPLSVRTDMSDSPPSVSPAPSTPAGNASVDEERNSYFRRLSTLPASTISKAVPSVVLKAVDATRGILFALSQIYLALKQYMLFAADERAAGSFNRVLEIASGNMGSFIDALDRFDSTSRRGTPEAQVILGVLAACKASVEMFRKVVGVLQLQLRPLQSTADVRYTRTLLLMLYGSMAEIANSWQVMGPDIEAVLPFLGQVQSASPVSMMKTSQNGPLTTPTLPSIAETTSPTHSPPNNKSFAITSRPRRRHAGSFSAQDVAHGANMNALPPSPIKADEVTILSRSRNLARGRAFSSASTGTAPNYVQMSAPPSLTYSSARSESGNLREDSMPLDGSGTPTSLGPSNGFDSPDVNESGSIPFRNGLGPRSNRSASNASGSSSTSAPYRWEREASIGSNYTARSPTRHVVDDHLLLLVQQVTSTASSVWLTLSDHLNTVFPPSAGAASRTISPVPSSDPTSTPSSSALRKLRDLRDLATSASDLTRRLQGTLRKVSTFTYGEGDITLHQHDIDEASTASIRGPSPALSAAGEPAAPEALARRLWDEANQFVRAVIPISQLIKSSSTEHSYPRELTRPLGELATGCSELLLHMHFLNPNPQSASGSTAGGGGNQVSNGAVSDSRTTEVVPNQSSYPFPSNID